MVSVIPAHELTVASPILHEMVWATRTRTAIELDFAWSNRGQTE
jgi:hypothetical protein